MGKQRSTATNITPRSSTTAKFRAVRRPPAVSEPSTTPSATTFHLLVTRETSTADKIHVIRQGLKARLVDEMVRYLDVPKHVVFSILHTPESTAHRLIRDNRALDPATSERVVRIADVTRLAEDIFGGREAGARWLKTPNLALADATPLSMLDTEPGAAEVRRVLSSIDYGGTV